MAAVDECYKDKQQNETMLNDGRDDHGQKVKSVYRVSDREVLYIVHRTFAYVCARKTIETKRTPFSEMLTS